MGCKWIAVVGMVLASSSVQAEEVTPTNTPSEPSSKPCVGLNPSEYAPAFLSGSQAELLGTEVGVSALVLGYDAVRWVLELSLGMVVGGDPVEGVDTANVYTSSFRFAYPIHRGVIADYALLAVGGAFFHHAPDQDMNVVGLVGLGNRLRVFFSPNVATVATLGVAGLIRGGDSSLLFGSRPLGSAGVVYFFR